MRKILKGNSLLSLFVYLIILSWVIMFKCNLRTNDMRFGYRSINLIPFIQFLNGEKYFFVECVLNLLVFIPFGFVFPSAFKCENLIILAIVSFGLSAFYEGLQYLLAFGGTDITDVIFNGTGGFLGSLIFVKFDKENKFLNLVNKLFVVIGIPFALYCVISTVCVFNVYI